MGYYIDTPLPTRKAEQLISLHDATKVNPSQHDFNSDKALICVVENGSFDAAGIAFSENERDTFMYPDGRPKTWLSISKEKAIQLCPSVARYLK
jgi:hypothetical protein